MWTEYDKGERTNKPVSERSIHPMKVTLLTAGGLALALLGAAHAGAKPAPKITPAQAEAAAVKKIPGKALSAKYEFEDGHWQYAVLVKSKHGDLYEAEVNSTTGRVTATEKTTPAEEASEAAADKKAAMSKKPGQKAQNASEKPGTEKAGAEKDDEKK